MPYKMIGMCLRLSESDYSSLKMLSELYRLPMSQIVRGWIRETIEALKDTTDSKIKSEVT